jgi:short-subunit dehydrogenase
MVIPGLANKIMIQSARVAPRVLLAKIARRLQEPVPR